MDKNRIRTYVILGVIFVVFTVIAFAVPFSRGNVFWLGYLFGVIAIGFQVYVAETSILKGKDAKSKFYGFPIARIGVVYLAAQILASFVEMAWAFTIPMWPVIIVNVVFAALAIVGCIAAETMREEIERQDTRLKQDVSAMRELQSLTASLPGLCQDTDLKKTLQNLAEDFKYSDPVSKEETKEMETELKFLISEIQRALVDGDVKAAEGFCVRVKSALAERNRVCKLGK